MTTMAKIGYARVSTKGQCDDSQVDELNDYGVDKLFVDHGVSGKHAARPSWTPRWSTCGRATCW
jgi:DNA invertase Pin-like site-specific DNA recombinase